MWDKNNTRGVPITAQGVKLCRDKCTAFDFDYFGFECPQKKRSVVDCECANSINPSEKVDDQMCQEFNVDSNGTDCVGQFVVNTDFGTYYMGAGGINSGYSVSAKPSQG